MEKENNGLFTLGEESLSEGTSFREYLITDTISWQRDSHEHSSEVCSALSKIY